MFHLTAPVTKRQLELLQARKRLEHRMSFSTLPLNDYGLAAKVAVIDAELTEIEQSKGKREVAA